MQNASYVVTAFASMALASVRGGPEFTPFRGRARLLPGAQSRARAAYFADGGRRTPDAVAVSASVSVTASVSLSAAVSASAGTAWAAVSVAAAVAVSASVSVRRARGNRLTRGNRQRRDNIIQAVRP